MLFSYIQLGLIPAWHALPLGQSEGILVYILPIAGSMLLFFGIYQAATESKTSSRKKMQDRLRGRATRTEKTTELDSIIKRGGMGQTKSIADAMLGKLSIVPKIQTLLDQGAVPWSASQMLVNLVGLAGLVGAVLIVVGAHPIAAVGSALAVFFLPIMALYFRRAKRLAKLSNQLPDVFDMMGQALRAGHSLAGAIQNIYEQMPAPIATEFAQVYHEQNLGIKIEDALLSMANRVDSLDIRFFVTAVIIQRQTGGDLAEVLENISGVIRERIELAGQVRALTAEGRLSGWVLFALPIGIYMATLKMNPDYAGVLLEDPIGQLLLIVAGGMQLMGLAMIRWIVNIKV